jgi:type I restriction enzyme S subunit
MTAPKHWEIFPLNVLVDVLDNLRVPVNSSERSKRPGPVPYYGATGQVGTIDKAIFNEELLVLGEDGVQFFDQNKPKAYKISGPAWVNNHAHVLRPKKDRVLQNFLLHFLNQFNYIGYANGTTRLKLTQGAMNSIPVPLPSIAEQHKIVELLEDHLSRLDAALIDVGQAKINAVQFRRSILQAAFSGKFIQETGYGEANWANSELGELCTFITDGSHNPPKGIEKSEYLMLSSRDINNGELTFDKPRYLSKKDFESENKRTDLQMDDVLLTTVGTIGRTAIYAGVPKNVTFQRSVSVLRPNKLKISSKFLMYFLDSITDLLNREARGVAQQGIYLNQVRKLEIPVPSLEEQLFLVELLDDHLSRLDSSFALADLIENQGTALRRSLLQAAFTGQLTNEVVSV